MDPMKESGPQGAAKRPPEPSRVRESQEAPRPQAQGPATQWPGPLDGRPLGHSET